MRPHRGVERSGGKSEHLELLKEETMGIIAKLEAHYGLIKDVLAFLKETRSVWLAPLIFVLLMLATLSFFLEGSVLAPAIYSIF